MSPATAIASAIQLLARGEAAAAKALLLGELAGSGLNLALGVALGECAEALGEYAQRDQYWLQAANQGLSSGQFEPAEQVLKRLLQTNPTLALAWNLLGLLRREQEQWSAAIEAFESAIACDEQELDAAANLVSLLEEQGRLIDAEAHALAALALELDGRADFSHARANLQLSLVKTARRLGQQDLAGQRLSELGRLRLSDKQAMLAHREQAHLHDAADQADAAIIACAQANAIAARQWSAAHPGPNRYRLGLDYLLQAVQGGAVDDWQQLPDPPPAAASPVFVMGFPRSGTSLLSARLGRIAGVRSVHERPTLERVRERVLKMPGSYPANLARLGAQSAEELRRSYWHAVAQAPASEGRGLPAEQSGGRLIDTHPLHLALVDVLHRTFPQAPILFIVRHPCDVCLSCLMQSFEPNPATANFVALQQTVALYVRMMSLWEEMRSRLSLRVHTIRYEDLVDSPQSQLTAACEFAGLTWESQLLDSGSRGVAEVSVRTASFEQTNQPIYRSAKGRWLRYKDHLQPYLPALKPWLSRYGYDTDGS